MLAHAVNEALAMAIAYFHTWTTYGTWLSGDERGWFDRHIGLREPNALRKFESQLEMTESALILTQTERKIVEDIIHEHCRIREWTLHAVQCLSNHVHVAVSAGEIPLDRPREQFKYWSTRRLKEQTPERLNWWTARGWDVYVDSEEHLANVIRYIVEGQ